MTTRAPRTLRLDYAVFFPSVNVRSLQPNDKVEQGGNYRVWVSVVFQCKPSLPLMLRGFARVFLLSLAFCSCFCILFTMLFASFYLFPSYLLG